ncbi:MAG: glycoside hydrolase family 16 protein [Spirochaetes bacterium]|nr:glycoside hydrolase family 16 protein [Spirochaetota bacterium]
MKRRMPKMQSHSARQMMLCCSCLYILCSAAAVIAADVSDFRMIDGKRYDLTFHDEFDGQILDKSKWQHRIIGPSAPHKVVLTEDAVTFDGQGNLVMLLYTKDRADAAIPAEKASIFPGRWIPYTAMLKTIKEFTYGYHEVRLKMPIVKGAGMSVWMQSRGQTSPTPSPDPKVGAEIDLVEQTFFDKYGAATDFRHSTIHWGGYGATHQWVSIDVKPKSAKPADQSTQDAELNLQRTAPAAGTNLINEKRVYYTDRPGFRDGNFHTVAVLWTPVSYQFFYDGESIGTIDVGVSQSPGYMILWPRLYDYKNHVADSERGFGGRDETEAKFVVDYYRIYQIK